jgi:AcrR family transcriptional regulator
MIKNHASHFKADRDLSPIKIGSWIMERSPNLVRKDVPRRPSLSVRKPYEERWEELLAAATELFLEKGYDRTTLKDIADRVGILKGSIYHYIKSKEDLRAHLLRDVHETGLRKMSALANGQEDPLTRLYNMIVAHVFEVCRNWAKMAVFLHEIRRLPPQQKREILSDEHAYRRFFQAVIAESQALGLIRAQVDPMLAAVYAISSLNSIYTWYRHDGNLTQSEIVTHLATTTLMGLATPKGVRILASLPPPTPPMTP